MVDISVLFAQREPFSMLIAFVIFLSYLVVDGLYTYYTLMIVKRRPFAAASSGAIMYVLLAVGVMAYTQNWLYLFPVMLGSFCGTFFVVRREAGTRIRSSR